MLGGRRAWLATVVGLGLGDREPRRLTALLAASTVAYDIVRIAGAAYLLWLGGTAIWKSLHRDRVRRWLDRATATVLIGLGIKLVTDSR
jgi:threonine/homoserine/homoserine lactone efflux protein